MRRSWVEKRVGILGTCALGVVLAAALYAGMSQAVSSVAADMAQRMSAASLEQPASASNTESLRLAGSSASSSQGASRGLSTKSATVSYVSEIMTASGEDGVVDAQVFFDDMWFFADPAIYNNELAATCAALCAACNSQSLHAAHGQCAFAEEALLKLGFSAVDTRSYDTRSTVIDELANIVSGQTDVVAYTFASKELANKRGESVGSVVFVGVRGTYGSEWLSNFNFDIGGSSAGNHRGFEVAADEVYAELARYVCERGFDSSDTRVLICGHSRGGAVANLLAARLADEAQSARLSDGVGAAGVAKAAGAARAEDAARAADTARAANLAGAAGAADAMATGMLGAKAEVRAGGWTVEPAHLFVYTFAAPNNTRDAARGSELYRGIFNVVSPDDVVPLLPLAAWGYGIYGTTVELPEAPFGFDAVSALASHSPDSYFTCLCRARVCDLAFLAR